MDKTAAYMNCAQNQIFFRISLNNNSAGKLCHYLILHTPVLKAYSLRQLMLVFQFFHWLLTDHRAPSKPG